MLLLCWTFVWFNVAPYVTPLYTNTFTFFVWTWGSTGILPFSMTLVYFFSYCCGFTGYFFYGLTESTGFGISVLEVVFANDLSYFVSLLDDFDALISILSEVLIFF